MHKVEHALLRDGFMKCKTENTLIVHIFGEGLRTLQKSVGARIFGNEAPHTSLYLYYVVSKLLCAIRVFPALQMYNRYNMYAGLACLLRDNILHVPVAWVFARQHFGGS